MTNQIDAVLQGMTIFYIAGGILAIAIALAYIVHHLSSKT